MLYTWECTFTVVVVGTGRAMQPVRATHPTVAHRAFSLLFNDCYFDTYADRPHELWQTCNVYVRDDAYAQFIEVFNGRRDGGKVTSFVSREASR